MIVYLGLLAVVCALLWAGYSTRPAPTARAPWSRCRVTMFDVVAVGVLAVFAGARWMVGTDFIYYLRAYTTKLQPGYWLGSITDTGQDVGYATLSYLARLAGVGFVTFSFLVSALTVVISCAAVWMLACPTRDDTADAAEGLHEFSAHPRVALALYVALATYLVPFNAVRQGLAIALVLLGVSLAMRGWRWRLVPLAMLTATLHYSSVVAMVILAFLFAASRTTRPRARIAWLGAGFAVPALVLLASITSTVSPALLGRYADYFGESGAGSGSVASLAFRVVVVVALVAALGSRALSGRPLLEVSAVAVGAVFVAASFTSLVFSRFDLYLFPFAALALPRLLQGTPRRRLVIGSVLALVAVAYFWAYLTGWGGLLPYRSVLSGPIRFGTY